MQKIRQPKNSLIAVMLLINIALTMIVLFKNSDVELEQTVSAQTINEEIESANRKKDEDINPNAIEEAEELQDAEILFDIKGVTSADSDKPTMPLYYHHSSEEGAWFTYRPLEEGETWDGGYWFVDYQTLAEANVSYLSPNDTVEGIFYDGTYFEIKEVVAVANNN